LALNSYFIELATKRLNGIIELVNVGERPSVDTTEAAILIQNRELDLQSAQIDNLKLTANLNNYFWQSFNDATSKNNFENIDSLDAYYDFAKKLILNLFSVDSITNPIISFYKAKGSILGIEKKLMREMIKPRLDVNYNVLSNNYTNNNFIFNSNNYKWGANISFPLFFRNPTNNYKMANIDLQNNSLELKLKQNEIALKKDQIKKSISVLSQQLKNATKSVTYNKLLVDAERLKFDNGESSLFLLNTRENKLLETELKLAEYKLKFIKTVVNLIYLNGDLNYKL
jgi:outer membrane protein TolC